MIYRVHMNISMKRQNSLYDIASCGQGKNYILATILFKCRLFPRIIINNNLCNLYAIISSLREEYDE